MALALIVLFAVATARFYVASGMHGSPWARDVCWLAYDLCKNPIWSAVATAAIGRDLSGAARSEYCSGGSAKRTARYRDWIICCIFSAIAGGVVMISSTVFCIASPVTSVTSPPTFSTSAFSSGDSPPR